MWLEAGNVGAGSSDFSIIYYLYLSSIYDLSIIYVSKKSESVSHSVMSDSAIPWTVTRQAPLSMEFSRQKYWSG